MAPRYSFFVAALMLASTSAMAQTPPAATGDGGGHGKVRAACKADIDALCKDVQPGGGRIKECLKAHADKLSQGCRDAIAAAKANGAAPAGGAPPQ
jgi:hypothetical protein